MLLEAKISELREQKIHLSFSNGWLETFKTRQALRSWNQYGARRSADNEGIAREFSVLQAHPRHFSLRVIFNAVVFGLFRRVSSDRKISKLQLERKEKYRYRRLPFLSFLSEDIFEKFDLMIVGKSKCQRTFWKKTRKELWFDYYTSKTACV